MSEVMVITGAGRGIGASLAKLAAQRGYAVAINYVRNAAAAEAVVKEISAAGGKAIAVQADVSSKSGAIELFEQVDKQLGPVGVLVNNAGIVGPTLLLPDMDPDGLAQAFATNVYSLFYCSGEAIKRMATSRGGKGGVIVNLSSVAARSGGFPKETVYVATKGAVDSFTFALAKEVAKEGIRANAVRPGLIDTDIHDAHGGPEVVASVGLTVPLGRPGAPAEVAELVLWLASPASSYVHGALIDIGGGR